MKICILSMQHVPNFGSLLQAFALKRMLEDLGHSVAFLDIEPNQEDNRLLCEKKDIFPEECEQGNALIKKFKRLDRYLINRLRNQRLAKRQNHEFDVFRRDVLGITTNAGNEHYDGCVIGSDEVFNCLAGGFWGFTSQLFGNVQQAEKVITYAASCGSTVFEEVPKQVAERIKDTFVGVEAFSVRDANTWNFVRNLTDRKILTHLDPALVYDFGEEMDKTSLPDSLPDRYCLVYAYYNRIRNKRDIQQIQKFCAENNLKLVSAGAPQMWIRHHLVLTPFQMLKVFQNAAFVITDTFHGTVFAAKYTRHFAVMLRRSNANKLGDLVARLGIEKHVIASTEQLDALMATEHSPERIKMMTGKERQRTLQYLGDHLKKENA